MFSNLKQCLMCKASFPEERLASGLCLICEGKRKPESEVDARNQMYRIDEAKIGREKTSFTQQITVDFATNVISKPEEDRAMNDCRE